MHLLSDQPKLILQKGKIEIEHFEKYNVLVLSWSGPIPTDDYQYTMLEMVKFINKLGVLYLLIDARDSETVEHGNWEWTLNFTKDSLGSTGLKKIARLGCGYIMREAQISVMISNALEKHKLPFKFCYKEDMDSALEWFIKENE